MNQRDADVISEVVQGAAATLADLAADENDFKFILVNRYEVLKSVLQGIEALELAALEAKRPRS